MSIYRFILRIAKIFIWALSFSFISGQGIAQVPFVENFGGSSSDPAWLLPSGGSLTLDTWKSQHPGLGSDLTYAGITPGVTSPSHGGLNALDATGVKRYAVTKIKYNDVNEFAGNNGTNINAGAGDHWDNVVDHTTGNGYFVIVNPEGMGIGDVIYQKTLNVNPGTIYFSAWLRNLRQWDYSTKITLKVEAGTHSKSENYEITRDKWNPYGFLYTVPDGITSITVSILLNQNDAYNWTNSFILDDIAVTDFIPAITITEPVSESNYCQWHWLDFAASYKVLYPSSIYKWQYRENPGDVWTDIPENLAEPTFPKPFGTLSSHMGEIKYSMSFAQAGYFRLLIADTGDTNYSDPVESQTIHLTMDAANSNDIIITQLGGATLGSNLTLKASTNASYSSPVFEWYKWENNAFSNIGSGAEYSTTLTATVPTSGKVPYNYYVTLQHDDLCVSPHKLVTVTADNNTSGEDFGGCGTTQPFIYYSDNLYHIPGYNYLNVDSETTTPNIGSPGYLITKRVYQHDFGSGITDWKTNLTDHSGCGNGYFLLVHANSVTNTGLTDFYKTKLSVKGGSKMSFKAWIANPGDLSSAVNFKFLATFDNGGTKEYTTGLIYGGESTSVWHQYGFDFFVPDNATVATFAITQEGGDAVWSWGRVFAMDDIVIEKQSPVQIITPESSEISVLTGQRVKLVGSYANGSLSGSLSYKWQKSVDGVNWGDEGTATTVGNGNFITADYYTVPVTSTAYYRLFVSDGTSSEFSAPVKIIAAGLTTKTYLVCPDNMTYEEAISESARYNGNGNYLPGMKTLGEPGYLPSLIRMEVEELHGVTYKWYKQETGGSELEDVDEYDPTQESAGGVQDPIMLSDGKSNTLSVQNERNTEGIFVDRTYWVEMCDLTGNAIAGVNRVPIHVFNSFICASPEAKISPIVARRLSRADFGGTNEGDPDILQTPLSGIDYMQSVDPSAVGEGYYQVSKKNATMGGGWVPMEDHIYQNVANEKHGYLVSVNATREPGLFYTHQLNNLGSCRNIELAFTGWFASPLGWTGKEKANLKFILTESSSGKVMSEFTTGNLIDADNKWRQFGFKFFVPDGINSLKLEIVNNNFGTSGGNDLLMDDIEIYLVMPPVKLVPAENTLVCTNNRTVALRGEYTDDGTLGGSLDYRWEHKANETDTWQVLTGENATGSVTNGIISTTRSEYVIDEFDESDNGFYRLVVGQSGAFAGEINYDCTAISEPRELIYANENQAPILSPSLSGQTAYCYDDADDNGNIYITNTERNTTAGLKYKKYSWILDGTTIEASGDDYDGKVVSGINLKITDLDPGYHTLSFTAFNAADCSEAAVHEFLIYPRTTTWIAEGEANNWNDSKNWSNGIPGKCTDVIIPNETMSFASGTVLLNHYPRLLKPTVETLNGANYTMNQENLDKLRNGINDTDFSLRPACDTISFKMGGAVARTDYLDYNFASVDLDIEPKRWYMVSAPLRSMYSGDYFVEGSVKRRNPTVYMMKYNASNPQTNGTPIKQTGDFSNPFNTLTEALHPGLGYAIWVDNESKPSDELQSFRFPKDSVKYTMWEYSGEYVNTVDIPGLVNGKRPNAGRFSYEKHIAMNGTLPAGYPTGFNTVVEEDNADYRTTMVGNPFMSHLDFAEFASANHISGGYYIWEGNSFSAFNPSVFIDDPNEIPPMQAFVVNKTGKINNFIFAMDMAVESPSPVNKGATLRSVALTGNPAVLRMDVLSDNVITSSIRLKYDPFEKNAYNERKDMWTLFSSNMKTPAVLYALLDGKAASVRTLGDLTEPVELGIRTTQKGILTLRLSGLETLDDFYYVYLEDHLSGIIHDMKESPEYTFDNQTGDVEGRFVLRFSDVPLSNESIATSSCISIYQVNNTVKVESLVSDPIRTVKIYSILGELLHEKSGVKTNIYSVDLPFRSQVIIVAVTTENANKNGKIILR